MRTGRGGLLERYLATDAIPYPGFSGGPLVDAAGQVVGVNTSGLARGTSLAIPASLAWQTAADLAKNGRVRRGYLGIRSQPVELPASAQKTLGRQQATGLLLVGIEDNSPASEGGLMIGDILVGLSGQTVSDPDELLSKLGGSQVGSAIAGGDPARRPVDQSNGNGWRTEVMVSCRERNVMNGIFELNKRLYASANAVVEDIQRSLVIVQGHRFGAGAGIIWRKDGIILTNGHVVNRRAPRVILANNAEFTARVLAKDPDRDLAVLQIEAQDLPAVQMSQFGWAAGWRAGVCYRASLGTARLRDRRYCQRAERGRSARYAPDRACHPHRCNPRTRQFGWSTGQCSRGS